MPDTDEAAGELALARRQVATLTGRLRCVEAERDAAVRDRDRTRELMREMRRRMNWLGLLPPFRSVRDRLVPAETAGPRRMPGRVPARIYVAVGLSPRAARGLVRALRQRIMVSHDHQPVVITDQPVLRSFQVPGVVLEYLPGPRTWARHDPGADWESLLAGRVAQLCRDYGAVGAEVIDPSDPPTLARLLEAVTAR